MTDEKKKMTAQGSSVGADDGQSISKNSKTTIPDPDEKNNCIYATHPACMDTLLR